MGVFNFLFPKAKSSHEKIIKTNLNNLVLHDNDYLGKAAREKHLAKTAIKSKEFDVAWGHLNKQKEFYLIHASKVGFTTQQTLALNSAPHEDMANILRMEDKHVLAFIHIVYWVSSTGRYTKTHQKKLASYFDRAKFSKVILQDIYDFMEIQPSYDQISKAVNIWSKE